MDSPGPPIRSTEGCWTCRLRKKKCDEEQPRCSRCNSVDIVCQYGPRPEWISNTALGKAELEHIKAKVSVAAKRKRAAFRAKQRASQEVVPKIHDDDIGTYGNRSPIIVTAVNNSGGGGVSQHLSPKTISNTQPYEDNETNLIMHYLDHVFFIQFRFYTPSVLAGGRGWLLFLLRHTKPLYHAALSLSAFHQQSLLSVDQEDIQQTQKDYLQELERHHNLTLEELQVFILAHGEIDSALGDPGSTVPILACMVELISFELFNGGVSNWQVHLTAATALILSLHGTPGESTPIPKPTTLGGVAGLISPDLAALNFFTCVIIWFDILACVSTNSIPHLSSHHTQFLSLPTMSNGAMDSTQNLDLSRVMGCQNWTMAIISEIAQLGSQRSNRSPDIPLPIQEVSERARDIQNRLEVGIARVRAELDVMRTQYSGVPPYYYPEEYCRYTTLVVTNTFSCTALIYLQISISSSPSAFHIHDPLQMVISAMRMIPDPRMVRGMVWPLCVAGCMASSQSDQEFFRSAAKAAIKDSRTFGNSCQALDILEMAWRLQKEEGKLIDCATCIRKLGTCVLLA